MNRTQALLEFLKIILSTQTVVAGVSIIFIFLFKKELKALIGRIAKIKLPGGSEISTPQLAKEESNDKLPSPITSEKESIPKNLSLNPEQVKKIHELFNAERANALLWEYKYLNYYFVYNTQLVLDWFAIQDKAISLNLFDNIWMQIIPDPQQRLTILSVLETHHLIQATGNMFEITPKGKEYYNWRGPTEKYIKNKAN